mgnify:CR=1 FL=1
MRHALGLLLLFAILFFTPLFCHAQPGAGPQPQLVPEGCFDVMKALKDAEFIVPASFLLANVADSQTAWRFTIGGKIYEISPAKRLSIVGGSLGVSLVLKHYFPKLRVPINIGMTLAAGYFGGKAYANSFNHGQLP